MYASGRKVKLKSEILVNKEGVKMKKSRLILFVGLILAFGSGASAQQTTLTFDELPFQPVVGGVFVNGVTISHPDADYNSGGPGILTFTQDPSLEGDAAGTLTLDFDVPTPTLQFGVSRSTFDPLTPGFTVGLFDSSLMSLGVTQVNTTPLISFSEGQFNYSGTPVKRAGVNFPSPELGVRFAFDNLTFEGGGPTPAPDGLDLSPESISLTTGPTGMPDFNFEVLALNGALQGAGSKGIPSFEIGSGSNLVNWTASVKLLSQPGANWLTISPTSGTATPEQPSRVTGTVDATKLPGPGIYQAEIEVSGSPGEILPVTVVVRSAGARLSVSQNAFLFQKRKQWACYAIADAEDFQSRRRNAELVAFRAAFLVDGFPSIWNCYRWSPRLFRHADGRSIELRFRDQHRAADSVGPWGQQQPTSSGGRAADGAGRYPGNGRGQPERAGVCGRAGSAGAAQSNRLSQQRRRRDALV